MVYDAKMKHQKLWLGLILLTLFTEIAYVIAFKTNILFPFFDLNGEANLPTWVTSTLLAIAGSLALVCYWLNKKNGSFWLVLAFCCLFISIDEVTQIHEAITIASGIKWVYFYAPVGAIAIALLSASASAQWNENQHIKIIMGGVLLGFVLSVGLETLSHFGLTSFWQKTEYMLEEGAEMLGAGMILIGCLQEATSKLKII